MARTAVVAGTATAVSGGVSRRASQRADEQAQQAAAQQQAAPQQQAMGGQPDTVAKIRELGEMRSQGLLTDEEFAAAKAQVLGT